MSFCGLNPLLGHRVFLAKITAQFHFAIRFFKFSFNFQILAFLSAIQKIQNQVCDDVRGSAFVCTAGSREDEINYFLRFRRYDQLDCRGRKREDETAHTKLFLVAMCVRTPENSMKMMECGICGANFCSFPRFRGPLKPFL